MAKLDGPDLIYGPIMKSIYIKLLQTLRIYFFLNYNKDGQNLATVARRAYSYSPPSSTGCQGPSLAKMHTLVDKLIISEDAEAIHRLSKPLAAVWNIPVQTVGLAAMQFHQDTPQGEGEGPFRFLLKAF